ncbi:hypothetical protein HAX54_037268 [Datura stramonium]|uniref:Uncharacterized protein n=1 Tax=Datura stramonium TaxID=4076 RepID=A0ABS8VLE6_DATST|nr:hypothetical protein [Datura stramonium]
MGTESSREKKTQSAKESMTERVMLLRKVETVESKSKLWFSRKKRASDLEEVISQNVLIRAFVWGFPAALRLPSFSIYADALSFFFWCRITTRM